MTQKAVTKAPPARPRKVARRAALMLTILVALSACGGGKGDRVGTAGDAVGEVPKVCQDARKAFNDWLKGSLAMHEATGKVVTDSFTVNLRVSTIRVSGGGTVEEINRLIVKLNASMKTAQQKVVKANELYKASSPLFNNCLASTATKLPPACADEIRQYPAVTDAQTKLAQAQTARLTKVTAVRTAMIARDTRAEAAAGKQETSATTQFMAALTNWNKTVLPKYEAVLVACNKAIS